MRLPAVILGAVIAILPNAASSQETELLWGDTHLHTNVSGDAFIFGNRTGTPDSAFMFAKGAPVLDTGTGARMRISRPLDFLVVADHAEYAGLSPLLAMGDPRITQTEVGARYAQMIADGQGRAVFGEIVASVNRNVAIPELNFEELRSSVWQQSIAAADRHNDPGNFSAFIGWEWSSLPSAQNLHRVVFMAEGVDVASQFIPFSSFDSDEETELWNWLEETSTRTGATFVAIPHNGNLSNGIMFPLAQRDGSAIDANYANLRSRWEPVVETTQFKGDSETHPSISPDDPFAEFETYEHLIEGSDASGSFSHPEYTADVRLGSYTRSGLLRGLEIEQEIGVNPYRFGMIGSTDSHTGRTATEEDGFWGKFSGVSTPQARANAPVAAQGWDAGASGLAAVWATENTREAIMEAFHRREVYATTGPRIQLRVFAGWNFDDDDANARDLGAVGYAGGVPMGSDLSAAPRDSAPSLLIHAVRDPESGNLDRVQVVKGWVGSDGQSHERIYDAAWSNRGREAGVNGALGLIQSTVDLETGLYTNDIGSAQLATVWEDPDFDPGQHAFYYVRVLEIPTPRHSTLDAIALGMDLGEIGYPITIQERAYSSPIGYAPAE